MECKVVIGDIARIEADAILVNHFEGVANPEGETATVDRALGSVLSQLITQGEIKGKANEITMVHSFGKLPAAHVVVVGLGKQADLSVNKIRVAVAEACRWLRAREISNIATVPQGANVNKIGPASAAQAITEGALLGTYTFRKHMTKDENKPGQIKELSIVGTEKLKSQLEDGVNKGQIISEATNLARDMVNEPANYMTPADMAEISAKVASAWGLDITLIEPEQMKELGMGGLLGVSRGSQQPPKFIVLNYRGGASKAPDIALVGKGITFDSGGISIKPSEKLEEMKGDMAGGAAAIAAMAAIARLKPKVNVMAVIPATENLPDGNAFKPGDVLTAMNGKTIEIISTDAEGRLILADALSYAVRQGAKKMVDAATLTGACRIALGDICTGAFSNNQELMDNVLAAGREAGELVWQMPMYDEYQEQNKSDVADIKNAGGRLAGAITAAKFLSEFVDDTPWVHLDIAGTGLSDKERGYQTKGATGVPVRTFINLVIALAEKPANKAEEGV
jgi:leucyl aminopeptidase